MSPRKALLAVLFGVFVLCVLASVISYRVRPLGLITGDGKSYYAWLRSVALDGDLDFRNDYLVIYPPEPLPPDVGRITPRGLVNNKYPVGFAVAAAPGFLVGHGLALLVGQPANGVSAPYQFAVTIWLQLLTLTALFFLWRALTRLGSDGWVAALIVGSAILCTNLLHYTARPAMAHAPGFAALCFAVYCGARSLEDSARRSRWLITLGGCLGLAVIARPSSISVVPFFLVLTLPVLRQSFRNWLLPAIALLGVVAIQVSAMSLLWGRLTFSGYSEEGFTAGIAGVANTLFSHRHGVFIYHPWYLVTLLTCVAAVVTDGTRRLAGGAVASFAILAAINGTWWAWWFGDSFGNRAFVEMIAVLVVPVALWVTRAARARPRLMRAVAAALIVLAAGNALLWSGYVLRRYPADGQHTIADAYLWPWR